MRSLTDTQRETLGLVSGSSLVKGFYLAGGFQLFIYNKWVCQRGLILRDTGVDLVAEKMESFIMLLLESVQVKMVKR
jgi:hypothetical protein